jgi:hypothetical protein
MSNEYFYNRKYATLISKNGERIFIDNDDLPKILEHTWCVSKTGYAVSRINNKLVKMHRFILSVGDPKVITDHKNRNKLDNRKDNLRFCTQHQNTMNCSNTKNRDLPIGVSRFNNKYRARIMLNRKEYSLGHYNTVEEAVAARRAGEKLFFGGFRG